MGEILSQALTSEHRKQILSVLGDVMHSSQLAKRDGKEEPILCQRCKRAQVTRTGELCRKCQKGKNDNKIDASLIDLAKKGVKPQAESTRNDEAIPRAGPSEIARLEMRKKRVPRPRYNYIAGNAREESTSSSSLTKRWTNRK